MTEQVEVKGKLLYLIIYVKQIKLYSETSDISFYIWFYFIFLLNPPKIINSIIYTFMLVGIYVYIQ